MKYLLIALTLSSSAQMSALSVMLESATSDSIVSKSDFLFYMSIVTLFGAVAYLVLNLLGAVRDD